MNDALEPHVYFFQEAYDQAVIAGQHDEVPVGAVIVRDGQIITRQRNQIIEKSDPTAHAELLAIRETSRILENERLPDCELYTTLEPCMMCTGALILGRVKMVHFLLCDDKLPSLRKIVTIPGHNHDLLWQHHEIPDIPAMDLLKNFFRAKRQR